MTTFYKNTHRYPYLGLLSSRLGFKIKILYAFSSWRYSTRLAKRPSIICTSTCQSPLTLSLQIGIWKKRNQNNPYYVSKHVERKNTQRIIGTGTHLQALDTLFITPFSLGQSLKNLSHWTESIFICWATFTVVWLVKLPVQSVGCIV